ncbi:hypothetical protein GGF32_001561 [Allomyces javanicus]|nr:hypothetical protein GGF32_001561 [Allomyces javanicus]
MPNVTTQTAAAAAAAAANAAAPAARPAASVATTTTTTARAAVPVRVRTISGTSAHSAGSFRSVHSHRSGHSHRRGSRSGGHHHGHHHGGEDDGYNTDGTSSSMSTLTFELSNTYILPEPFLVFCPFDCDDQTPYASVHPLLDHLLSAHGIKIADVGVVAGVMTAYLDEWARRVHGDSKLQAVLATFANEDDDDEAETAAPASSGNDATSLLSQQLAAVSLSLGMDAAAITGAALGHAAASASAASAHGHGHRRVVLTLGESGDVWDRDQRARLTKAKLEEVLKIQDKERQSEAHLPRKCLFCKSVAENRAALFRHMFAVHSFNIGLPDNLVYVSHFLDLLSEKLARLQCLYCERTFKSSAVLRKHMRKKRHFRISPRNHEYDRFYIVNYLEPGKNWETLTNAEKYFESDDDDRKSVYSTALTGTSLPPASVRSGVSYMTSMIDDDDDAGWSDWEDDEYDAATGAVRDPCPCLFCDDVAAGADACVAHMAATHKFDLQKITKDLGLSLYQTIVLVNYLRRAAMVPRCARPGCTAKIATLNDLAKHIATAPCLAQLPRPNDAQQMHVQVNLADPAHSAFGDEETLRQVAAELRGAGANSELSATANKVGDVIPEQWKKVGDTVVVVSGTAAGNATSAGAEFWSDPQYLFPALDGDPLLSYGVDHDDDDDWDADPVMF